MRVARSVATVTLLAFLSATTPALAQSAPGAPSPLRASIDRAVLRTSQAPAPVRPTTPLRREQAMGGGGGGSGMMLMTLLVTAASLAGTYLLVKEMRKSSDQAAAAAQ